jgi:hypothetical protein
MRPATLDRVENGGSGSDINPRERKPKEPTRDKPSALRARDYPVCRRAHGRQGRCAPLKRWPEDGPSLTAAARVGVGNLRSGQKNACGAVDLRTCRILLTGDTQLKPIWRTVGKRRVYAQVAARC